MKRVINIILITLLPTIILAQQSDGLRPGTAILLRDEGTDQGRIKILNCVGAGVTCTSSGITGTLTASGGGSGNFVAATIDFGVDGNTEASVVVTGQAWVGASSTILCTPTMMATADRIDGAEDAMIEGLTVAAYARVAGTGFTVMGHPDNGVAIGKFLVHCSGA